MIRLLTGFIFIIFTYNSVFAQDIIAATDSVLTDTNYQNDSIIDSMNSLSEENSYLNGNGYSQTGDMLPQLLRDVKVHLTDAIIADVHKDTNEVLFNLDRIFELLAEADQFGDMTSDDQEEFDRFEQSLIDIYTDRLKTLSASDISITAEKLRRDVTTLIEPIEVEIGNTKYTVLDDRDGHIPLVTNKKVEQFIQYFQTKGKKQFDLYLSRYAVYGDMIHRILDEYSLPEELVYLAMVESGLNPVAYSRANASGMWQFIYSTGITYGLDRNWYIDERRDPEKATRAACQFLSDLYNRFDNWYLALGAYNAGGGRINRAVRLHQTSDFWQLHSLPRETRNYVPFFLATAIIGKNPQNYGFYMPRNNPLQYDIVEIEKSADLSILAQSAGITLKQLKELNPELRQSATPAEPYSLRLPVGSKYSFEVKYASLPESKRFAPQYVTHRVKKGENLGSISRKYNVSIHDIAAVNKIKNRHKISVRKVLTIPTRGGSGAVASSSNPNRPSGTMKKVYTVRKGDTLSRISQNNGVNIRQLRTWNGIKYGGVIYPGQKLVMWVKRS